MRACARFSGEARGTTACVHRVRRVSALRTQNTVQHKPPKGPLSGQAVHGEAPEMPFA